MVGDLAAEVGLEGAQVRGLAVAARPARVDSRVADRSAAAVRPLVVAAAVDLLAVVVVVVVPA